MSNNIVKLGEIAALIRGITYKPNDICTKNSDHAVACMRTKNIQSELDKDDIVWIPKSIIKNPSKFLQPEDILVSSANSWNLVGKACWVPPLTFTASAGGFISILRGDTSEVDNRYLFYWFTSNRTQTKLRSFSNKTTNISNLDHKRTLNLEIPLPPIEEQRRIAKILDKKNKIKELINKKSLSLHNLKKSIFLDFFGNPITNPKGWEEAPISNFTSCIVPGRDKPKSFSGNIPWITTDELLNNFNISNSSKNIGLTLSEIKEVNAKIIPRNSVLMSCVGNLGTTSISRNEIVINQQLHSYQCSEDILPEFLTIYLPFRKPWMKAKASQTTLPYLNKANCNAIPIFIPPLEVQKEFVQALNRILLIDEIISKINNNIIKLEKSLNNSLFVAIKNDGDIE